MKRPLNLWIASTLTALVVFGSGVQSAHSQPGNPAPGISKTHIRTVEFESQRNACTRMWENVYHVQLLDEAGNPVGATREMRHRSPRGFPLGGPFLWGMSPVEVSRRTNPHCGRPTPPQTPEILVIPES